MMKVSAVATTGRIVPRPKIILLSTRQHELSTMIIGTEEGLP
jgi:hypothetical protein